MFVVHSYALAMAVAIHALLLDKRLTFRRLTDSGM